MEPNDLLNELSVLKDRVLALVLALEVMMAKVGITAATAATAVTAAAPMSAAAMAGGGAHMPAAVAPMPAAVAPVAAVTPTATLKITLNYEVDLKKFLPKLDGEMTRSELSANKAKGYIWVNFASPAQAALAHKVLLERADLAYKFGYKQAK